jgi:crotonobetainyl-CoA:carnitine CoA-transferase CaiB-like acyl-CoA transferase
VGQGQALDLALYDAQLAMLANGASNVLVGGQDAARLGNAHLNIVPYQLFDTADGTVVVTVGNDRQFVVLAKVLGRPDLAQDEDYRTNAAPVAPATRWCRCWSSWCVSGPRPSWSRT